MNSSPLPTAHSPDDILRRRQEMGFPLQKGDPWQGPIFNQDSTEFFYTNRPEQMSGELIDRYIDLLAHAGIGAFVSCVNAQRANYASRVWETDWEGFDPDAGNDQPILRSLPLESLAMSRNRLESLLRLSAQGIDFHERAFARCRLYGIATWISIRMNDVHDCTEPNSPLLSRFYKRHRAEGKLRSPHRQPEQWWSEFTLDWELAEVRDHYLKLILERLERDDLDVLELDWMRFVYNFRPGRELAGGKVLTGWLRPVRQACDEAGRRLGRRVLLAARVPADPQTARRCGLDGIAWAQEGLADILIPSHFIATDFDIPIETWRPGLPAHVRLAGSIDNVYRATPPATAQRMTPGQVFGAAANLLHAGADSVYLYNFFPTALTLLSQWSLEDFHHTVSTVRALETIVTQPRCHLAAFRDHRAPGEPPSCLLPAKDSKENFPWPPGCLIRLRTGPRPIAGSSLLLRLTFAVAPVTWDNLSVYLNGQKLLAPNLPGPLTAEFSVPADLMQEEAQVIELVTNEPFLLTGLALEVIPP